MQRLVLTVVLRLTETDKAKHTWILLYHLHATHRHRHTQTNTPAPPQPHPAGPGCLVGLGSSSESGPCWLKVSPSEWVCVYVCVRLYMYDCLSASALSVSLQHVSDTQGREWKREGGVGPKRGCGRGAEGEGSNVEAHKRLAHNSLGYNGKWADTHLMRAHIWEETDTALRHTHHVLVDVLKLCLWQCALLLSGVICELLINECTHTPRCNETQALSSHRRRQTLLMYTQQSKAASAPPWLPKCLWE